MDRLVLGHPSTHHRDIPAFVKGVLRVLGDHTEAIAPRNITIPDEVVVAHEQSVRSRGGGGVRYVTSEDAGLVPIT